MLGDSGGFLAPEPQCPQPDHRLCLKPWVPHPQHSPTNPAPGVVLPLPPHSQPQDRPGYDVLGLSYTQDLCFPAKL